LDLVDAVYERVANSSKTVIVGLSLLVKNATKLFSFFSNFGNAFLVEALVDVPDIVEAVKLVFNVLQLVDGIVQLLSWRMLLIINNVNVNVFCGLISIKQCRRWSR
jgi:hypothetical protein